MQAENKSNTYCHFFLVTVEGGLVMVIGFIELLQLVTISNYNRFTNSHTVQFTTAYT
jgi:hypothetical protein